MEVKVLARNFWACQLSHEYCGSLPENACTRTQWHEPCWSAIRLFTQRRSSKFMCQQHIAKQSSQSTSVFSVAFTPDGNCAQVHMNCTQDHLFKQTCTQLDFGGKCTQIWAQFPDKKASTIEERLLLKLNQTNFCFKTSMRDKTLVAWDSKTFQLKLKIN